MQNTKLGCLVRPWEISASEMTYIVSSEALNFTHSLTLRNSDDTHLSLSAV